MAEAPAKDRVRGRRDSTAAQHLDGLFEEMRSSEARVFLIPIVKWVKINRHALYFGESKHVSVQSDAFKKRCQRRRQFQ
jgi:hypothetical protein